MADNWRTCEIFGELLRVSDNERVALFKNGPYFEVHIDCLADGDPGYIYETKGGGTRRFNIESARYAHMEKKVYSIKYGQKEGGTHVL